MGIDILLIINYAYHKPQIRRTPMIRWLLALPTEFQLAMVTGLLSLLAFLQVHVMNGVKKEKNAEKWLLIAILAGLFIFFLLITAVLFVGGIVFLLISWLQQLFF